ncbi:uncharacterized protein LOC117010272 [Catharus ustulatus]|uniref:uncharacterized protein LOC117010272 n=1 Tax=Catharus ustulatus TaxID=91951 RepID=UPI001409B118|nr:uncharacterized protein LOC117010272 [Catharus ustulatus]
MGRSSPGDHDYLHSSESPRDRELDSLHSNQEGPVKMGSTASVSNKNGVQGKALVLLTLVCIMQVGEAFVKIIVPEPDVIVPEGAGVNLTCLFSSNQRAGLKEVKAAWKQITTDEVFTEEIVTLWDMEQQKGSTTLMISHMQADQVGQFSCVVWIRESFNYEKINVDILKKNKRVRQVTGVGKTQQELGQENLIVGLVRDFGQVQNTTSITACLPLPKAAGEPIPWGIIPMPEPPVNKSIQEKCIPVSRTIMKKQQVIIGRETLPLPLTWEECRKRPDYDGWTPLTGILANVWLTRGKGQCSIAKKGERSVPTQVMEFSCQNVTSQSSSWDEWKTIWGPSLLESYSYIGPVHWCIEWSGQREQKHLRMLGTEVVRRDRMTPTPSWNCSKIITCDTPESQIGLVPVRILLKWGCECQRYNHTITGEIKGAWKDCQVTTVRSPGHSVWVMGHRQWTAHMPINGPVTQITLGVPTLCPLWKQSKLTQREIQSRTKRETNEVAEELGLGDEDEWHEPSSGVKFGWVLESLFAQISTYRNREMLYKLLGQTERLAAVTKKGFRDLNLQLQATTRMTVQNRMALDLLLLKEHGVCGYLQGKVDHCCVHIPNVTEEVEKDISQLKQIETKVHEVQEEAEHNWVGALFSSLGIQVSGWISSIVQYVIMIVLIIVVCMIMYRCLLGMIAREGTYTRRVMRALTRKEVILPSQREDPPSYLETIT